MDLDLLTVAEAAVIMRVSKMTVYRMIHAGEIRSIRVGKSFRIDRADLMEYLNRAYSTTAGVAQDERNGTYYGNCSLCGWSGASHEIKDLANEEASTHSHGVTL